MDEGGCWCPWVTAEVTSVVADICWATNYGTMWVQLTMAGLMKGKIKLGYLLWAPSGFTRTLGWCIGVTRVANKSGICLDLNPGLSTH